MTLRQSLLKFAYPLWMLFAKATKRHASVAHNKNLQLPVKPIYDLQVFLNDGSALSLQNLTGRKILFVNTASDCGYTGQYEALQKLYERYKGRLEIIAFPCNDFKEQEKSTDNVIQEFCSVNFNIKFPIAIKSSVKKIRGQNEVFQWLTNKTLNGWSDQEPEWNFSKYILNEEGVLTAYFGPSISPMDKLVIRAIED
jgi:glutathione peroxidase